MTVGPCCPVQIDGASSCDGRVESGWGRPRHSAFTPTVALDAEQKISNEGDAQDGEYGSLNEAEVCNRTLSAGGLSDRGRGKGWMIYHFLGPCE